MDVTECLAENVWNQSESDAGKSGLGTKDTCKFVDTLTSQPCGPEAAAFYPVSEGSVPMRHAEPFCRQVNSSALLGPRHEGRNVQGWAILILSPENHVSPEGLCFGLDPRRRSLQ